MSGCSRVNSNYSVMCCLKFYFQSGEPQMNYKTNIFAWRSWGRRVLWEVMFIKWTSEEDESDRTEGEKKGHSRRKE